MIAVGEYEDENEKVRPYQPDNKILAGEEKEAQRGIGCQDSGNFIRAIDREHPTGCFGIPFPGFLVAFQGSPDVVPVFLRLPVFPFLAGKPSSGPVFMIGCRRTKIPVKNHENPS